MTEFHIDPDLARAATLPSRSYIDPEILRAEQSRIFGGTWQYAGSLDALKEAGDFITTSIAGEPVVVACVEDGSLRAFSNVCRHRAGPVAVGCGHRKALQCAYHGWTYGLDGRLLGTPEFDGVLDFKKEDHALPGFRVGTFGPLVFVNLGAGGPSLHEVLGAIPAETRRWHPDALRFHHRQDYELACNWKVYVDNYLEGYHIPVAHPELFRLIDYGDYRVELFQHYSKQHAPVTAAGTVYHRDLGDGEGLQALYYWIFPNLMLNLYPDHLQVNHILPLGPERTLTRFEWYAQDPLPPDWPARFAANLAFSDSVQQEDIFLCEAVQRGLRSRTYDRGRYSAARENGVHHFHRLWCEGMNG